MKNGDVRGACLALIKSRLGGAAMRTGTQPAALGWKLENASVSATELATLCAASFTTGEALPGPYCWRPSPALRAFFAEYRKIRACTPGLLSVGRSAQPPRPSRLKDPALDRRPNDCRSH